jgi:hypothetical protein
MVSTITLAPFSSLSYPSFSPTLHHSPYPTPTKPNGKFQLKQTFTRTNFLPEITIFTHSIYVGLHRFFTSMSEPPVHLLQRSFNIGTSGNCSDSDNHDHDDRDDDNSNDNDHADHDNNEGLP